MLSRLASRRVNGAWVRYATTSAPRDTTGLDYKKRFGKEDYVDNEIRAKTYVRTGQAASIVCSRRIQNLAEAMSLIRAVEERVGPVLQFEFQKDYISRAYTWRADIVFKNSESRSLIKHGVSFTLPPGPLAARPEGSGLAELGAFLQPRQHNPELELKPLENVSADKERQPWTPLDQPWTITITPAKNPLNIQKRISHYPRQRVHNVAKWGGFTHLDALPDHIPLTPDAPQAMMRYALERWSRYGNEDYTPKPAIIAEHPEQPVQAAPKQDSKTSPQLVSEPVVETSTETTDVQEEETVQQSEPEPEPVRVKRGPPPRPTPAARRVQKPVVQAAEADDAAQRAAIQQANALKAALAKGRRAAKPVVERKKVEVRQTKRVEHKPVAPEQPVEATVTEKAAEVREESGEAKNDVVGKLKKSIFGSWL
ncbi:hypothetical protein CYLTODRAFT_445620 [Cylindrobasidium torrendii FP15055 ss-10]|uniref:Uncharacterized protein n=1 Tax=Cylindrobasidium torrendii FP15055 ss-10 TaxID=1314674 RepID=A0A0D7B4A2_9AGAR|nr:hypothetical protein CYLTODRAFT_445620 [Cylindrobasidium torrendii FP15055 ss-10]